MVQEHIQLEDAAAIHEREYDAPGNVQQVVLRTPKRMEAGSAEVRRARVRASLLRLRERRKAAGICRECGKSPIESSGIHCMACRLKHNTRAREWKARLFRKVD